MKVIVKVFIVWGMLNPLPACAGDIRDLIRMPLELLFGMAEDAVREFKNQLPPALPKPVEVPALEADQAVFAAYTALERQDYQSAYAYALGPAQGGDARAQAFLLRLYDNGLDSGFYRYGYYGKDGSGKISTYWLRLALANMGSPAFETRTEGLLLTLDRLQLRKLDAVWRRIPSQYYFCHRPSTTRYAVKPTGAPGQAFIDLLETERIYREAVANLLEIRRALAANQGVSGSNQQAGKAEAKELRDRQYLRVRLWGAFADFIHERGRIQKVETGITQQGFFPPEFIRARVEEYNSMPGPAIAPREWPEATRGLDPFFQNNFSVVELSDEGLRECRGGSEAVPGY